MAPVAPSDMLKALRQPCVRSWLMSVLIMLSVAMEPCVMWPVCMTVNLPASLPMVERLSLLEVMPPLPAVPP